VSWVAEEFDHLKTLWQGDKDAWDASMEPFWNSLRSQLKADIDEYNELRGSELELRPVAILTSSPTHLAIGYERASKVAISVNVEDRCMHVVYCDSTLGQPMNMPITGPTTDFPKLSRSILLPVLFHRLMQRRHEYLD
jgi:hypothetical protein